MIVLSLLHVALLTAVGRLPDPFGDEVFFKAAGRELARSGHFAAPELTGAFGATPSAEEIFFFYPPVYPLGFGLVVKVAGFGWRQCVCYDAAIHALAAFLTYRLARSLLGGRRPLLALLAGLLVLPLGRPARPDDLAVCFGLVGLLVLLRARVRWKDVALSGAFFGLTAGTSSPAAVVLGLIALPLLWLRRGGWREALVATLAWAAPALLVVAAILAPILLSHPSAYHQYLKNATYTVGSGIPFWEKSSMLLYYGRTLAGPVLGCSFVGLLALPELRERRTRRQWLARWLGPALGFVVILTVLNHNHRYFWLLTPWLLAVSLSSLTAFFAAGRRAPVMLALLVAAPCWLYGASDWGKNWAVMLTCPEPQSMASNRESLRGLIPDGSRVLTYDSWWALGDRCRVFDGNWAEPDPAAIDFVVLGGNGKDPPGDPRELQRMTPELDDYIAEHFDLIHDNLNREPVRLFGRTLTSGTYGFGTYVLRRRQLPDGGQ